MEAAKSQRPQSGSLLPVEPSHCLCVPVAANDLRLRARALVMRTAQRSMVRPLVLQRIVDFQASHAAALYMKSPWHKCALTTYMRYVCDEVHT